MKRIILLCTLCIAITQFGEAQEIKMYKTFGGVRFEMDTLVLSPKQVLEIMKIEPVAYAEFKKAKTHSTVAGILGFTGGVLLGIPLGTAIAGGEPEWGLAAGGAALILGSIHFDRLYKGRAFHALELYNKKYTGKLEPTLHFYGTQARLVIRF